MSLFPSNPGPSFNPESSFSQPLTKSTDSKAGLRHVSIKQVLRAVHVETHFEIDGREVGFVVILANVYDVNNRGGKLDYGLDDGTGRIKAYKWVTEDEEGEREVAEYEDHHFSFARVIGKISEFRGIYSINLVKISREVNDPHEIYHHLTRIMVESLMFQHGPPSHDVVEAASHAARLAYPPPETVETKPLRDEVPSPSDADATERPPAPPPRTPSPEPPHTPRHVPASVSRSQAVPMPPPSTLKPNTVPRRRNYRIGERFSPGPNHDPGPSTPLQTRLSRLSRPSFPPTRLGSPSGPSVPSTAALNRIQASPEFVSPTSSPPPSPTRDRNMRRSRGGEDMYMSSSPSGKSTIDVTPDTRVTKKIPQRRDPYSHLSTLQRDIMLTIQNTLSTSETEEGVPIEVLVRTIASRRSGITQTEFADAFTFLLDGEYIYNTIDETHFACT